MRLLVRADDAGLCDAVNRAIVDVVTDGVARNVSVMAPVPAFGQAAAMLRTLPDIAVGLHVTLSSEWHAPRWGSVLPASDVSSLLDPTGCFFPSPADLHATGRFDLDEAVAEVTAQLERARQAGLEIRYLDEHMGLGWLPGLRQQLRDVARRESLVYAPDLARLPALTSAADRPGVDGDRADEESGGAESGGAESGGADPGGGLAGRIRAAADGTYLLVTHPGLDTPDLRELRGVGYPDAGTVAVERDSDRRALLSADVRSACQDRDVSLIRYTDLGTAEVAAPPS
jgi:chitin disaccharide deacetylase